MNKLVKSTRMNRSLQAHFSHQFFSSVKVQQHEQLTPDSKKLDGASVQRMEWQKIKLIWKDKVQLRRNVGSKKKQ